MKREYHCQTAGTHASISRTCTSWRMRQRLRSAVGGVCGCVPARASRSRCACVDNDPDSLRRHFLMTNPAPFKTAQPLSFSGELHKYAPPRTVVSPWKDSINCPRKITACPERSRPICFWSRCSLHISFTLRFSLCPRISEATT